ncbi:MAG: hypothetical protein CMC55_08635 [Flavobacteriaceae bacterium]|nr:hypothetical protein [Flavobacteriaceae bacterium]|tara:strand:- start:1150 stop:1464 length:315 start_codon:yes stop_codon:yes gene_type:complete
MKNPEVGHTKLPEKKETIILVDRYVRFVYFPAGNYARKCVTCQTPLPKCLRRYHPETVEDIRYMRKILGFDTLNIIAAVFCDKCFEQLKSNLELFKTKYQLGLL